MIAAETQSTRRRLTNADSAVSAVFCGQDHPFLLIAIKPFHFRASPRRLSQELETRRNTRVLCETANWHFDAHRFPTHMRDELFEHHLESDAVEWVQRTSSSHFMFSKYSEKKSVTKLHNPRYEVIQTELRTASDRLTCKSLNSTLAGSGD